MGHWNQGSIATDGFEVMVRADGRWIWARTGEPCVNQGRAESKARPLVVIDPEDREQVERLCAVMKSNGWTGIDDDAPSDMQAVLRALIAPPKPDEPQGLGAVVEDADGLRWVRDGVSVHPWRGLIGSSAGNRQWASIAAVRVLSEGVQ